MLWLGLDLSRLPSLEHLHSSLSLACHSRLPSTIPPIAASPAWRGFLGSARALPRSQASIYPRRLARTRLVGFAPAGDKDRTVFQFQRPQWRPPAIMSSSEDDMPLLKNKPNGGECVLRKSHKYSACFMPHLSSTYFISPKRNALVTSILTASHHRLPAS